jgi:UDP-N-acetylglucosamine acyltransferase
VTINRGTEKGGGLTQIGHDNYLMAYCHIAHDCRIGNGNVFANNVALAGHVEIGDFVSLGGYTLIHQFCRVGSYASSGMGSALNKDLAPFLLAAGHYARLIGLNRVGLRRRGFSRETVAGIDSVFRVLLRDRGRLDNAEVQSLANSHPEAALMLNFIGASKRGMLQCSKS